MGADRDDLEAEADARLDELQAAEPIPFEQQLRESREARREAYQKWMREVIAADQA